jgi:hypothetical protein
VERVVEASREHAICIFSVNLYPVLVGLLDKIRNCLFDNRNFKLIFGKLVMNLETGFVRFRDSDK